MVNIDESFLRFKPTEQLAMLWLLLHMDEQGAVSVSIRSLATEWGMSYMSCRTIIQGLIRKSELSSEGKRNGTSLTVVKHESYRAGARPKPAEQKRKFSPPADIGKKQEEMMKRKKEFYESLVPFLVSRGGDYPPEMIRAFFDYWSEPNKSGTRMRYEMEKTWETSRRLCTWARRTNSYGNNSRQDNQEQQSLREGAEVINDFLSQSDIGGGGQ